MSIIHRPFRYHFSNVTVILVVINILVYAAQRFLSYNVITSLLALNIMNVLGGDVWQFFTYMFAHGNFNHLLFNMLALFLFGYQVEREMGSSEFLLYYLVCGVFAGALSFLFYLFTGANYVFLLGASGAIFAVQLAFAVLRPDAIIYFWGIIPLRAPVMVLGATAIELGSTLIGSSSNVAHLTHLFGFAIGWLYFVIRFRVNPARHLFRR
ncbi:MAG: rhomboid family intramembrane serine protease [Spirochaetaceae bacterium]|jgi:membrane associated rhomboid family serine protease|nr:rhomboid family intramembrane serine protease [Spirochaetaceae bacterium]